MKYIATREVYHEHELIENGAKRTDYENRLRQLHVKLVDLQDWVRHESEKMCILFEVRDAEPDDPASAAPGPPNAGEQSCGREMGPDRIVRLV